MMILRRLATFCLQDRGCCMSFHLANVMGRSFRGSGDHRISTLFRITHENPPVVFASNLRAYSTNTKDIKPKTKEEERLEKAKSKRAEPETILLVDEKGNMSVMTVEDAGKVAKKKGLNLIEVDPHSENIKSKGKQVYKLLSKSQYYGDDWKHAKEAGEPKDKKVKEEKTVLLKGKTNEHDVLIKVKSMKKWVEKGHTVRVFIGQAGEQGQNLESVYKIIENAVKDEPIRIIQKIVKNSQIRFQLMPPKAPKTKSEDVAAPAPASESGIE